MSERITYELSGGVATITMDDGKVNALGEPMLADLAEAFDRAAGDEAIVVLAARGRAFSAGFDLRSEDWQQMVGDGARLAERILAFPHPVIAAAHGSAVAMGAFLLLCADHRIGVTGEHRTGLNEVAIGMTVPWFGIEIARHRLTRPAFDRCLVTGALLGPEEAVRAGFLDDLVAPGELVAATAERAAAFGTIDRAAHAATKLRVRREVLAGVRAGIELIEAGGPEI